ncbi:MAG: galactokinase [Paludibacter sp.]
MTVQELKSAFVFAYHHEPDNIYFAPGHINLIGEHTDYDARKVIPSLSFGIYFLIRKNNEKYVKFWSLNEPEAIRLELNQLTSPLVKTWVQYPLSVFAEFISQGFEFIEGFDILIWGNVPIDANFSTANALKVITAYALNNQLGTNFITTSIEEITGKTEHEFAFVNYAVLEQHQTSKTPKDDMLNLKCDSLQNNFLPLKMEGMKIIISNTHTPHRIDIISDKLRKDDCLLAVQQLNKVRPLKCLTELTEVEFKSIETFISNPVALKRARHIVGEVQRSKDAINALKDGDLVHFGQLMNTSHDSLRDNFEIVSPEVDAMVAEAMKIDGVIGSRMTGSGFGGCTISLVKEEAIDTFIKRIGAIYETHTGIKNHFFIAEIGDSACKLY